MSRPRVAIAHDYLTQRGGAERVVLAMLRAFPEAEVHTLLYDPEGTFPEFRDAHVVTSPLNRLAPLRRHHRLALPLLAPAASRLRVDADVTLVSTSGWAHGFDIRGRSLVYCHNPARWLYQADDYLGDEGARSARRSRCGCSPRGCGAGTGGACPAPGPLPRELLGGPRPHPGDVRHRGRCGVPPDDGAAERGAASRSARSTRGSTCWCRGCCRTRTWTRRSTRSATCPTSASWSSAAARRRSGCAQDLPGNVAILQRGQRRRAALGLRALRGPGGAQHRGLRPHARSRPARSASPRWRCAAVATSTRSTRASTGLFFARAEAADIAAAVVANRAVRVGRRGDRAARPALRRGDLPRRRSGMPWPRWPRRDGEPAGVAGLSRAADRTCARRPG